MTEHSSSSAGVITYALPTRSFCSCLQHHAFKLRTGWVEKTLNLQPFLLSPQLTMFASSWNDLATFLFTALNSGRTFCVHALFVFELTHCSVAEPVFHPALSSLQPPNLYFASSNDSNYPLSWLEASHWALNVWLPNTEWRFTLVHWLSPELARPAPSSGFFKVIVPLCGVPFSWVSIWLSLLLPLSFVLKGCLFKTPFSIPLFPLPLPPPHSWSEEFSFLHSIYI